MTPKKSINFAVGVRVVEHESTNEYQGSGEALVSSGIVSTKQLPGQPGMAKSCATFYAGVRVERGKQLKLPWDEGYLRIQTAGKKFKVTQGISQELKEKRRVAIDTRRVTQLEIEEQVSRDRRLAEMILRIMVHSADDYRKRMLGSLQTHVGSILISGMRPNELHGFSVDDAVSSRMISLLSEMTALISDADIHFNASKHAEVIQNCKLALAKGDPFFQRAIQQLKKTAQDC